RSLESSEPYDDGGDNAVNGKETPLNDTGTHNPNVITVDGAARNKDNVESVLNTNNKNIFGSTSSRKDTRERKYATETSSEGRQTTKIYDDNYESKGENTKSFGQMFESPNKSIC
nr:ribonuclease H-like domain-containing protein [Tanacetum cinerariifolium]